MMNLAKSVFIANKLLGLLLGNNFSTPMNDVLEQYPDIRFFS